MCEVRSVCEDRPDYKIGNSFKAISMKQGKSMSDLMDRIREVSREFGVNVLVAYDAQKPAAPVLNKREIRIVEAARDAENREGYSYLSNAQTWLVAITG